MNKPKRFPEQDQSQPGKQHKMYPEPQIIRNGYKGSDKLNGKIALITGGDSGIGRSIAVHFAREGAHIAIVYLEEGKDARETKEMVEKEGRECLILNGDLKKENFCRALVKKCLAEFNKLDILVNNAAVQFPKDNVADVESKQVRKTFENNIYPYFYLTNAVLEHLKPGSVIINTASVTAYRGSRHLLDYSSSKGAIVSFTRSLSRMLINKKIRVNGVAPGPIWTPLIPSTFNKVADFGKNTPMGRAGQPAEVAPAYVFLASEDSSYITGQFIHINGGEQIGS